MKRSLTVALCAFLTVPTAVQAGPREDATTAFESFFAKFTTASAADVAGLFAPDALFYGTSSRELVTTPAGVRAYFDNAFGTPPRAAGAVKAMQVGTPSVLMLSDTSALVSSMWQTERTVDGKATLGGLLRVTAALAKRGDGWQIVQFHNSNQPAPPAPPAPAPAR